MGLMYCVIAILQCRLCVPTKGAEAQKTETVLFIVLFGEISTFILVNILHETYGSLYLLCLVHKYLSCSQNM